MSQTVVYKLRPRSPFHVGERGIGIEETAEILHSDTLFSAIVSAWTSIYSQSQVEKRLEECIVARKGGRHALHLSSAFPYADDLLFFPRPMVPLGGPAERKVMKGARFVSEGRLRKLATGETAIDGPFWVDGQWMTLDSAKTLAAQVRAGDVRLLQGALWVTAEEMEQLTVTLMRGVPRDQWDRLTKLYRQEPARMRLWQADEDTLLARVAVDRASSASTLFYCGRVHFSEGCGLWFSARFGDPAYREDLERALNILQDEGIGGRRSVGHGQFSWSAEERALPVAEPPNSYLLLSLYHPTAGEVEAGLLERARYRLINRRGWIYSPDARNLRRKGVRMLSEGSLLSEHPTGDVVDVTPDRDVQGSAPLSHHVYRYGLAFIVPLGLEVR